MLNGGGLQINPGSVISSTLPSGWGGIVVQPGGEAQIEQSTIANATTGISANNASLTVDRCRIQDISGIDGGSIFLGPNGEDAYAIKVTGTNWAVLTDNTIERITGGSGVNGGNGTPGSPDGDEG